MPEWMPSDVVAVLLYLTDQEFLLADPERLHRALLQASEFSPILQRLGAPNIGPFSMSHGFDEALNTLKLVRIVGLENTNDYDCYVVDDLARGYIRTKILPRFNIREQRELKHAAAVISEACGVIKRT